MSDQPLNLHQLEQALTAMAENLPPYWRRMFLRLMEEGFTEDQAMRVLCAAVHGSSNGRLQ